MIFNTYNFYNHDNNKFILLLQKGVYPNEYMDDWEKFNETLLPEKESLYSHWDMEDITDVNYVHAKSVCKNFEEFQDIWRILGYWKILKNIRRI